MNNMTFVATFSQYIFPDFLRFFVDAGSQEPTAAKVTWLHLRRSDQETSPIL